jgi:SNF2 family DNA or RNA helicase
MIVAERRLLFDKDHLQSQGRHHARTPSLKDAIMVLVPENLVEPLPVRFGESMAEALKARQVQLFAMGWQSALSREISTSVDSSWCQSLEPSDRRSGEVSTVSLRLQGGLPKTIGFSFEDGFAVSASNRNKPPSEGNTSHLSQRKAESGKPPALTKRRTRIKPPEDLVKLEDRLYFVLQPPLETLLSSSKLEFPFTPFPYQYEGIGFLFPREKAILADEMGLGKTMQAISAIRMLLRCGQVRNVLLICPKPLVTNWVREFQFWAPEIPVAVIEGDASKRNWIWSQHSMPVRIANYELLMRDRDVLEHSGTHFDLVALDEAQRIKNRNSTTAEIVRSLPRSRSWALTGTPIENSVEDLVSIFEFLSPGTLRVDMHLRSISKATRDYILRRTKDQVLTEMPPKMYRDAELELSPAQTQSYRSAEEEGVIQLSDMGDLLTIQHVFELVLRLKQICNFDPATGNSCKLERLLADMEEIAASGKKAIVFSQWVDTLEKISVALQRFGPAQYHGRIPSARRDEVIRRFKEDPSQHVILMSYGAGSVGLNLQFCEYVFLFDRWWNPAVEDQAINRAHRIGAAGTVTVTRMMTLGTIEQRIHDVLEQKRELFNQLFAEAGPPRTIGLNQDEIFGLFNLKVPKFKKQVA